MSIFSTIFNLIFGKLLKPVAKTETDNNYRFQNTTAIIDAVAAIIWICVVCLAIYMITTYGLGAYFWVKSCLKTGHIVNFPVDTKRLFDMIYSLLGLGIGQGAIGIVRKIIKRL